MNDEKTPTSPDQPTPPSNITELPKRVNPGEIGITLPSAVVRNLYTGFVWANEKGTFGGQSLENQKLLLEAGLAAKQALADFDEAMSQARG